MSINAMSRRNLIEVGVGVLTGTAVVAATTAARASTNESANEMTVRRWYKLWEKHDWQPFDAIMAADFTFTSPNGEDHISKTAFKTECWDNQIDFIKGFDLEFVAVKGNEALVKYLCHMKDGKSFRNVEYLQVRDQQIHGLQCFFGSKASYPSAVASQRG